MVRAMKTNNLEKKKVLLLYPGRLELDYAELPLSILYLGGFLESQGIECLLVDMRFTDYKKINHEELLCVGISTMTGSMIKSALKAASYFKGTAPNLPIVWGGVHPSLLPEQTLDDPNVDIVVIGEGEKTLLELVKHIQNQTDISEIEGIGYKKGGRIIINPPRDFIDLDELPIELPYHKLKLNKYHLDTFPLHTSRGCPYNCGFCYNPVFNKRRYRAKSPERVLQEIEYIIKEFNPKKLSFFQEDEFFIDLDRVKSICQGIVDRKINIKWESFCRLNNFLRMDDEMLKLIEKSGCCMLSFGGESGDQEILNLINKGTKVEHIFAVAERIKKTEIEMIISFMMGLPGETYHQFLKTCEVIEEIVKINPECHPNGLFLYTPYPGTQLFQLVCEKYDYKPPDSLKVWGDFKIYRDENKPWLNKKMIKKYKYISILTRFPFYTDRYEIPITFNDKFLLRTLYKIYSYISHLRWKKKWFSFPLELWILELVLEKKRGYV